VSADPTIVIVPVGEIPGRILPEVRAVIAATLGATVVVGSGVDAPSSAYDPSRRQYHSTRILDRLAAGKPRDCEGLLGVADVDLYVPDLNFVFGEADRDRGVAVFSLARLRPPHSGKKAAEALFLRRAATEAIHELGHTYGLGHCRDAHCVMWFSNTLAESDRKGLDFCTKHSAQLAAARERERDRR